MNLLHKEDQNRVTKYLERVHIDIAGLMPMQSAGGRKYLYIVVETIWERLREVPAPQVWSYWSIQGI